MKLNGLYIFFILLASIAFCACLNDNKEGMTGRRAAHHHRRDGQEERRRIDSERDLANYRRRERRGHGWNNHRAAHARDHIEADKIRRERRSNRRGSRRRDDRPKYNGSVGDEDIHDRRNDYNPDYDRNSEIYNRTHQQYNDVAHYDVDDHSVKRRVSNRARVEHPGSHPRRMRNADKYMLKSEVVPPVCPAGNGGPGASCPGTKPPPPCPPCARCPEPAFDCKKVPNYSSGNNQYLPKPFLNDFSTFGA